MAKNWESLSNDLKEYIIKMNPSFKDIHMELMNGTKEEINMRRRDFSCVTCTRMTIFSSKPVCRRPSTRLFATQFPGFPRSSTVRVCGECDEHLTKPTMGGLKIKIPRKFDHDKESLCDYIKEHMECEHLVLHYGLDECDQLIRSSVLDGNIINLYEEIKRPRWTIMRSS